MEAAAVAHAEHHGPPPAHRSSRVHAPTLGMLLFIMSEIMIFGAFFTAYFFIRVVNHNPWPAPGTTLPEDVAGVNTAILLSSSLTLHWALTSIKNGNRFGLKAGMRLHLPARPDIPDDPDQRVHPRRLLAPLRGAVVGLLRAHGLHGAHVFIGLCLLLMVTIRSFRGHYSPEKHEGMEVPGIYWHFVDAMWIVVYTTVYVL